jgi:hypothetical protein
MSDNTRRDFLKTLALAPLVAVPVLTKTGNAVLPVLESAPTQPPPYGPAERTAIIDRWITRLDEVTTGLERYWSFLLDARSLAPAEVDGVKMVNFESEIHALADSLVGYIDCDYDGDNLITALTGRGSGPVCVEAELTSPGHRFDRAFWQREVDALSEDHPEERGRLQALLDARYEGVL